MDPLEEEFGDLRNWRHEVLHMCQAFEIATGTPAEIITIHPATLSLMRQLANQSHDEATWIPMIGDPHNPDDQRVRLEPNLELRLELSPELPLSAYQVGCRPRVRS